jgi:ABC-type Zn uptake system ZnuABC Zn-binding protein ZnuA/ABC-type Mn2+/Zn2+ transport system permease subunit
VLAPFQLEFVQRGVLEVLLLSAAAGLLGTWIVMRGLSFYAHAVGTAAFPGLVLADGLGFSAPLGAFAAALIFAFGVERLARGQRAGYDSLTALVLVAALAGGVVLASDVFGSGGNVDSLLFGSLLLTGTRDLVLAGLAGAAALLATFALGPRWLARGFDAGSARAMGLRSELPDAVLLVLVAFAVVSSLTAIGALLATAMFVVPAATTRLWTARLITWQLSSVALAAAQGVAGLWLSVELNTPPGPTVAVLGGSLFAASLAWHGLGPKTRRPAALVVAAAALVAIGLAGCGSSSTHGSSGPEVVATTTQIGDWAREVGGDKARVHQILQPNTDPHDYEPRPADVEAVAGAGLVLLNGDRLDAWMGVVLSNAGGSPRVVDLGATVPVRLPGAADGPEASRFDPHWWHDPRNAEAAVRTIRDELIAANPGAAETYRANAAAYLRRLGALDSGIRRCLARVPRAERRLVSDHDAFAYFAHRFAIAVVGAVIPSQTTQAQASAADVERLIRLIRREGVHAVFPESSLSKKLAQQIARETGARAGSTLFGDTLGPAGSRGATYVSMEQANADAMARGFTGGARGCAIAGLA